MTTIITQEKLEERECMYIRLREPRTLIGVTTRTGKNTNVEPPSEPEMPPLEPRHVHFDPEVDVSTEMPPTTGQC